MAPTSGETTAQQAVGANGTSNGNDPYDSFVPIKADEVTSAFSIVHVSLTGAIACMVDKHNALAKRVNEAHERLFPYLEHTDKFVKRVKQVEGVQAEIRSEIVSSSDTCMKELKRQVTELTGKQDELQERLRSEIASTLDQQISQASQKHAADMESAIDQAVTPLKARLDNLERAHEKLNEQMEVGFRDLRTDMKKASDDTKRGISMIEKQGARVSGLATDHQSMGVKFKELSSNLTTNIRGLSDQRKAATQRFDHVDNRLTLAVESLETTRKNFESEVSSMKEELFERIRECSEESEKRTAVEMATVCDAATGPDRLKIQHLEEQLERMVQENTDMAQTLEQQAHQIASNSLRDREWLSQQLSAINKKLIRLEGANEEPDPESAHNDDSQEQTTSSTRGRAPWHSEVSSIWKRMEEVDSRQSYCSDELGKIRHMVCSIKPLLQGGCMKSKTFDGSTVPVSLTDTTTSPRNSKLSAAVTTKCLSCGAQRLPTSAIYMTVEPVYRQTSARTRSPTPPSTPSPDVPAGMIGSLPSSRIFPGGFRASSPTGGTRDHDDDAVLFLPNSPGPQGSSKATGKLGDSPPVVMPHAPGRGAGVPSVPASRPSSRSGAASADHSEPLRMVLPPAHSRAHSRPNSARARFSIR